MLSHLDQKKMARLLSINHLLTESLDLNTVLRTLVCSAKELLEIADTVILYLFDEQDRRLKVAEGVGINIEAIRQIAFLPGESLTGKTFVEKKPLLFSFEQDLRDNMKNMSEENYRHYFEGVFRRKVRSAFCVPLLNREKCLGVLAVDNFEKNGHFTENDMYVVEAIAAQSAIAILNSKLFQKINDQNKQLAQSLMIHENFTREMLNGGGIENILSLLGRILKSSVSFKRSKEGIEEGHDFAIIRSNEPLGYIQSEKRIDLLSSNERAALEHASTALALELMKQNALYEKELHFREEIFDQVFDGTSVNELKQIAGHLSISEDLELECIIIEGKEETLWNHNRLLEKEQFVKSVEEISRSLSGFNFVFTKTFKTVVVVPVTKKQLSEKIATAVDDRWKAHKEMIYGIGRKKTLSQLGDSYREALDAVRYGKRGTASRMIRYSNLGAERLWQKVDRDVLENYISDHFGQLFSMGGEYYKTLETFIKTDRNHKKTAELLYIHPNTLYNRLKKIERELNISMTRESDWLNLLLAYKIHVDITNH